MRVMHSISLFACLLTCACTAQVPVQRPWQSLQMPTWAEVKKNWVSPPSEYGPEPYYGLNGPFTLDVARRDLDHMHQLGFRAVTVQYGWGSGMQYLSPEWFAFFRDFVAEAKKRDMRIWIVDDAGYPSGFAGGKFTSDKPELRMQALVAAKSPVAAGSAFDKQVSPDTVAVTAISATGETQAIPFSGDHTQWTAPAGSDWTVYVVEHAFRTSPTRSDTNPKRTKDGTQSLEDYLDPAATAEYLSFTHDAYKRAVGEEFGKTILGFRGDEPDYSLNGLPWTPKFFATFEAKKGYDIRPYLAAFLQGREIKLTAQQLRARADYYDVFADMFRDGFFKPQAEWCKANGLEYQVHLNHEEMQIDLAHSEGNFFRDMRFVQVPGIDSIWHQIWTDTVSDFPRFASSAAHVYGHPRSFTESFAAYRPEPDVTMARYILNEQFVRGINLIEMMYYPSTATPGRGGPAAYMQDPQFPALTEYARRMSYMLSMGRPTAEVALLLPSESLWMADTTADNTFVSTERVLSEHQIDFDIVDEDAIAGLLPLKGGAFVSISGNRYRTVLVPHADLLPSAVIERLHAFTEAGGHVVFLGATPAYAANRTDLQAKSTPAKEYAWATVVPVELEAVPTPPAQPPSSAPAPMTVPQELLHALRTAGPASALQIDKPEPAIRFLRRRLQDATVFLIFNESGSPVANHITLAAPGHTVELWDAQTGRSTVLPGTKRVGEHVTLPLNLTAYATEILVVR